MSEHAADLVTTYFDMAKPGMPKRDWLANMRGFQPLPPHPSLNAQGFTSQMSDGVPFVIVGYFKRKLLSERLAAYNIIIFDADNPPSVSTVDWTEKRIVNSLTQTFGTPRFSDPRPQSAQSFHQWNWQQYAITVISEGIDISVRFSHRDLDPMASV